MENTGIKKDVVYAGELPRGEILTYIDEGEVKFYRLQLPTPTRLTMDKKGEVKGIVCLDSEVPLSKLTRGSKKRIIELLRKEN